jgi:broad specificity phosphatase PhoE
VTPTRVVTTVRHAATANAHRQIISGRLDEPLSPEGVAQARKLRAGLGPLEADLVISSPLARALDTARILTSRADDAIERAADCVERSYGLLEGMPPDEVATWRSRIRYVEVGGIEHSVDPPGGETLAELRGRCERFAARILERPVNAILVFSHQVFLQQFQGMLLALDLHEALALDIAVLQIDEFTLGRPGSPAGHRLVHPGIHSLKSW